MNVSPHRNILFCGSDGHTTFVHLFSAFNVSGRHFVTNPNLLRESNVPAINHFMVAGMNACHNNDDIVILVYLKQLPRLLPGIHQNFQFSFSNTFSVSDTTSSPISPRMTTIESRRQYLVFYTITAAI